MRVIVPPIKSQGIKTKLVPWIKAVAPSAPGRWIEPFFGTGILAFNMQYKAAILNDINPHLIRFYKDIQGGIITPQKVGDYLETEGAKLRVAGNAGYDHYRSIRNRFNAKHDSLDFLFLSRAGFNGMIRFNKTGGWNIPFCKKPERFSQAYITKIVNQVRDVASVMGRGWKFYTRDFEEIISMSTDDDLIYCDPPYLGRYVDYYNGWTEKDEERLFIALLNTKAKFILSTWHHNSYRDNPMIDRFWRHFNIVTRDHFYHSGGKLENRRAIVEALVFNYKSDVRCHNHDVIPKPQQLILLESTGEYLSGKAFQRTKVSRSRHSHLRSR